MSAPGRAGGFLAMIGACLGLIAARATIGSRAADEAATTVLVPHASQAPHHKPESRSTATSRRTHRQPPAVRTIDPPTTVRSRDGAETGQSKSRATAPATQPRHTRIAAKPTTQRSSRRQTIDGTVQQTQFGPLQVTVVMQGSEIVDVSAPVYPNNDARSRQINAQALPQLRQQVLDAQSAGIDGVSGATVTSDAYELSLQSALDRA